MNKKWLMAAVSSMALLLGACSQDNSVDNHPKENMTTPKDGIKTGDETPGGKAQNGATDSNPAQTAEEPTVEQMDEIPFTDFDFEVEYSNRDEEVDINYERNGDQFKAKFDDSKQDKLMEGKEGFQAIYEPLKSLDINKDTNDKDAIDAVLKAFQLSDDYKKAELEYTLKDGTKKEFKSTK